MAIPGRCSAISRLKTPPCRNACINGKLIAYQQFGIGPAFCRSNLDNHGTILLSSLIGTLARRNCGKAAAIDHMFGKI
jgi:hypothetical protein